MRKKIANAINYESAILCLVLSFFADALMLLFYTSSSEVPAIHQISKYLLFVFTCCCVIAIVAVIMLHDDEPGVGGCETCSLTDTPKEPWLIRKLHEREERAENKRAEKDPKYRLELYLERITDAEFNIQKSLDRAENYRGKIIWKMVDVKADINKLEKTINTEVSAGHDEESKRLIAEKRANEDKMAQLISSLQFARESIGRLTQMLGSIQKQKCALEAQQSNVNIAQEVMAAQRIVSELYASIGEPAGEDTGLIQKAMDVVEAQSQLNMCEVSEQDPTAALAVKYESPDDSIEQELAAIKERQQKAAMKTVPIKRRKKKKYVRCHTV